MRGHFTPDISGHIATLERKTSLADADLSIVSVANGTNSFFVDNYVVSTLVPEPSSLALLGIGGLMLGRRRKA